MTPHERSAFQWLAIVTGIGGALLIGFGDLGGWEILPGGALVVAAVWAGVWSSKR